MTTRKLDKRQWCAVFDRLSKTLEGKQAEIEVASLCPGDQVEAEWIQYTSSAARVSSFTAGPHHEALQAQEGGSVFVV
jgi:hypothetical protein